MANNFLVPVDGSENSRRAVLFAAELVAKLGGSVMLLHVLDRLPARKELKNYLQSLEAAPNRDEAEIESVLDALTKSGEARGIGVLEEAARAAKDAGAKRVDTALEDGDPATEILRYVDSGKYDVVVMGRRGLGSLKGFLMGSLSHKISNVADCTVVTVN